ncbi:MAG: 30S ribosomal protein S18, partial [Patescibacteria group bacterium]
YKDTELLKKFLTPHGRLMAGKRSGVSAKNQRKLATAVKRARFMGLLPFVAR